MPRSARRPPGSRRSHKSSRRRRADRLDLNLATGAGSEQATIPPSAGEHNTVAFAVIDLGRAHPRVPGRRSDVLYDRHTLCGEFAHCDRQILGHEDHHRSIGRSLVLSPNEVDGRLRAGKFGPRPNANRPGPLRRRRSARIRTCGHRRPWLEPGRKPPDRRRIRNRTPHLQTFLFKLDGLSMKSQPELGIVWRDDDEPRRGWERRHTRAKGRRQAGCCP